MTREELRDKMLVSGELERFNKSDNWAKAVELYKNMTGDKEVSLGCGTCYKKIKVWLLK